MKCLLSAVLTGLSLAVSAFAQPQRPQLLPTQALGLPAVSKGGKSIAFASTDEAAYEAAWSAEVQIYDLRRRRVVTGIPILTSSGAAATKASQPVERANALLGLVVSCPGLSSRRSPAMKTVTNAGGYWDASSPCMAGASGSPGAPSPSFPW